MRQLVILAGGKGKRLGERLGDLPKPMADIAGKPLLQLQLELARVHGFTEAVLLTGYRSEAIEAFFGGGAKFGMQIRYQREQQPLGTAGALVASRDLLADRFVVMYGDTLLNVDLGRMWAAHVEAQADVTLFLHPNDHPHDSDLVELDDRGYITAIHGYPHQAQRFLPNLATAALYVMERRVLPASAPGEDLAKHLFPRLLADGTRFFGYRSPEYIKDMGTPERCDRVLEDWRSGTVARCSLREPVPAVFLDRDGTLTRADGYIRTPDQLVLIDGVGPALRKLNRAGVRTAIVTNQPVVARGECTEAGLSQIHAKLETELGRERAYVDRIYFCPHHPDAGFSGERGDLKIPCGCRKPGTGMIEQATRDLGIDLARSWLVGDTTVDVRCARNAGVRSVLLRTGEAGADWQFNDRPDFVFHDLPTAVDFIVEGYARLARRLEPLAARLRPGQVVALAGLAHSGKSTAASVLQQLVATRGYGSAVVSLDGWIRAAGDRPSADPSGSYDYSAIADALTGLKARTTTRTLQVPQYDRATRTPRDGATLEIGPSDVVFIEGVVALDVSRLRDVIDLAVWVECDEVLRRQRFLCDYRWRGYSDHQAEALYQQREHSEHHLIRACRARADVVVEHNG